jgi:hypothetical protein
LDLEVRLNEVTHLQDSSLKDTERAGAGFSHVQFKDEALVIKSVTRWHWQDWSSLTWIGLIMLQLHWRREFPKESRITLQLVHWFALN